MIAQEFTPITYAVSGTTITAGHVRNREIDLGENFTVTMLEEMPEAVRTNGTSMGTFRSGRFRLEGIGSAQVLLDTDKGPFVLFTTETGRHYLFHYDPVFQALLE